jgi:antitoxin VapB
MALSIKTDEADRLARELATATRESLTEAVTVALRERLERVRKRDQGVDIALRIDRLTLEYAALPVRDARPADEILGYDDAGLPT